MFYGEHMYQYLHDLGATGWVPGSGTQMADEFYRWQESQRQRIQKVDSPSSASTSFHLVLAFPQGDFADKLEDHEDIPMWIPASGTTPQILGVFGDEKQATQKMEEDRENVHVQYTFRLGGREGIVEFLEFMANNDMMTPSSGR
jgi:hypothetical protein